jgi:hypothetical protein
MSRVRSHRRQSSHASKHDQRSVRAPGRVSAPRSTTGENREATRRSATFAHAANVGRLVLQGLHVQGRQSSSQSASQHAVTPNTRRARVRSGPPSRECAAQPNRTLASTRCWNDARTSQRLTEALLLASRTSKSDAIGHQEPESHASYARGEPGVERAHGHNYGQHRDRQPHSKQDRCSALATACR